MKVPFLDLRLQYQSIQSEVDTAVAQVFAAQQFRGGPVLEAFEKDLAQFTGIRNALGVGSGTDALLLLLKALPLKPGDEIITTPFSFFATAGAIIHAGGTPVFADIEADTLNINPEEIEALISPRTRAILPVHIFGQCARMDAITAVAKRHDLILLEDAAQALGARYKNSSIGSWGTGATLSFYPTKNLGGAGEGGAILTNDDQLTEAIRLLRSHGTAAPYRHVALGFNSHLHTLQAAVLQVKLKHLSDWNETRRTRAHYYTRNLGAFPEIITPVEVKGAYHVYHQYVIRVPKRDALCRRFKEHEIGYGIFYPIPLYKQPCLVPLLTSKIQCPITERCCDEVVALPMYPELRPEQQDFVIAIIKQHLASLSAKNE